MEYFDISQVLGVPRNLGPPEFGHSEIWTYPGIRHIPKFRHIPEFQNIMKFTHITQFNTIHNLMRTHSRSACQKRVRIRILRSRHKTAKLPILS